MRATTEPNDAGKGARALWRAAGQLALAAALLWTYAPALRGSWLWDDDAEISANRTLRDPAGWWKSWIAPTGMDYFPLKSTAQWVEWHLWGERAAAYHLVNLALHFLSALLIWRLLEKLLESEGPSIAPRARALGGWAAAALFALHPVAVESVAWISEFKNTLSLPLVLMAFLGYVGWEGGTGPPDSPSPPARRKTAPYLASLAWYLAAMLSKSSAAMFPAVLLLYVWWRRGRVGWNDVKPTLPFFAVSVVLGAVTVLCQEHWAIGPAGVLPPLGRRVAEAGWSALFYLRQGLWPVGIMPIYAASGGSALPPWGALAVLVALPWHWRRSWGRHALLGLGWFYLNLLPAMGIVPMAYLRIAPRADHLAYLPLVGLAGLAGAAIAIAFQRRKAAIFATIGICLPLAVTSRGYADVFQSQETLWSAALQRNPGSWLAAASLGKVRLNQGRWPEAAAFFREADRLGPPSAEVHANLGYVDEELGRRDEARAEYEESIRIDPGFSGAHYNLGHWLLLAGDPAGAAMEFRAALHLDPTRSNAHNNYGLALVRLGRNADAIGEFRIAISLDPKSVEARVNLGNALYRSGRTAEAVEAYRTALRIDPSSAMARHDLEAVLRLAQGGRAAE